MGDEKNNEKITTSDGHVLTEAEMKRQAAFEEKEKKPFYKRIPKPVVVLTVITLLAGLALSGVYSMTKDSIEALMEG